MQAPEAIRLEHLSFCYAGQQTFALQDISLTVGCGELVVVMGATGAGKSTLAKVLNRTVPAFQAGVLGGTIAVLGRRLEDEGVADLAGIVGLVSQDFEAQLFATNVVQEIAFAMEQLGVPVDTMRERVPQVLATVGLAGFESRDPATLSGGEKQRLAIAATVALQPKILVLDEPTTDLDPVGKLEIFAVLATMRQQGYTLILIEHEIAAAEHADRLLVLSHGRIVADGRPQSIFAEVNFLEQHGIRPPDLHRVAAALKLKPVPQSLDEAAEQLNRHTIQAPRTQLPAPGSAPPASGSQLPAPLVEAAAVTFDYEPERTVLHQASLTIRAGEFVALIGQNGSGKTTLAKHLNGLLSPTKGVVRLHGTDMHRLPLNRVASDVGYVFQNPDHQIFAASVFDEIAFGPRNFGLSPAECAERVEEALQAVGLTDYANEDPFLLSKGHRQRLAVGSLLALRPKLLILDEPTTGLDYAEQRRMMDLIARLWRRGMAILMITHSPWVVAEYAQRGVLMRDGRVLFDGPLRALFAEEALLASAHFRAPDVTRLGRRLGFTPLSVDELVAGLAKAPGE